VDEAAGEAHDDPETAEKRQPPEKGRKAGGVGLKAALCKSSGPLHEWIIKHHGKLARWSGISGLALGVGLMAGGLEPIGFSLILLGTAVVLLEFDRRR